HNCRIVVPRGPFGQRLREPDRLNATKTDGQPSPPSITRSRDTRAESSRMIARFRHRHAGARPGITLIEALVLCIIIVLLILILLPAIQAAREAARKVQCVENLKQLAQATHQYVSANGVFPPGARDPYDPPGINRRGIESWLLRIMQHSEFKYAY